MDRCTMPHLFLGKVLAVVCALRRANVVETVNQASIVAVDECEMQFENRIRGRRAVRSESNRHTLASFVHLHAPSHGLAKRKCAECSDDEDERAEYHLSCSGRGQGLELGILETVSG